VGADTVSDVLGLRTKGPRLPMTLMSEVEKGLPLTALDRLAKAVAPDDAGFAFRMVSRATLARRRKALATARNAAASRLSADESARVARLGEVWALAREVWPLFDQGKLKPVTHRVFPLGEAQAAHNLMRDSAHIGKILLAP